MVAKTHHRVAHARAVVSCAERTQRAQDSIAHSPGQCVELDMKVGRDRRKRELYVTVQVRTTRHDDHSLAH